MKPRVLFAHPAEQAKSGAKTKARSGASPEAKHEAGDEASLGAGDLVELDAARSHHLRRVLRLQDGAAVEAFDGAGHVYDATLVVGAHRNDPCRLQITRRLAAAAESPLDIRLAQCLSSADRMDWTIEKAVELGVRRISALGSRRSQLKLDDARAVRKHEHWQRIIESACAQSRRVRLPVLDPVQPLERFLTTEAADEKPANRFALDPGADLRLSDAPRVADAPLVLLVGPESGFSDEELQQVRASGFVCVSLGPRVLRTETAGLAAISALQALAGDF